jgi:serine/threonine protein phosphatase PrpC
MSWPVIVLCLVAILFVFWLTRSKPATPARRAAPRKRAAPAPNDADEDITLVVDRATLTGVPDKNEADKIALAPRAAATPPPAAATPPPAATPAAATPPPAAATPPLLAEVLREAHEELLDEDLQPVEPRNQESRALLMYESEAAEDERTGPIARVLVWAQGDSDQGLRRTRNEDAFLVLPDQAVFAVADGMGGYEGGQVASNLAVQALRRTFEEPSPEPVDFDPRLPRRCGEVAKAMLAANQAVFDAARTDRRLARMGTTLVTARFVLNKQRVYVGHVGDSRCYRLRNRELRQLTTDHTLEQLGFAGPRAKDLTRAIGLEPNLELDLLVDKPRVDDVYLLCSDGLTKMVDDDGIRDAILDG